MWVETVDGSDTLQTRWPCAAAAAGTNDLRKEFVSSVNQVLVTCVRRMCIVFPLHPLLLSKSSALSTKKSEENYYYRHSAL